jgi:DNA-binding NtrC family response regulator
MTSRATLADARREFEERYVRAALARSGGRAIVAARELGVSRQGLRKLTTRLGLEAVAKTSAALE